MARLSLSSNAERRKKIVAVLIVWVEMCTIVSWLLTSMMSVSSLRTYRPRFRSYSLSNKRKAHEMDEVISEESFVKVATLLGDKISEVGKELSKSIASEMVIQRKVQELYGALCEIDGLTEDEKDIALSKIPDQPNQMLVFFSLPSNRKLGWIRRFLTKN